MLPSGWRYRHTALVVCTLAYFATRVEPVVVGPLVPDIAAALEGSQLAIGTAMTGFWAAYALVQLPSGLLAGRLGERRVALVALAAAAFGSLALALSPTMIAFAIVAALLGGGVGLYYNVGVFLLSDEFEGTGRAIGIHRLGSQAAGLVVPVLAVAVGARYGWRVALGLGFVAALPTAGLVALSLRSRRPAEPPTVREQFDLSTAADLLARPAMRTGTVLAGVGEFVAVANLTFLPTVLVSVHGLDRAVAGVAFSFYFLVVSLTHPVSGWFADRTSPQAAVTIAMAAGVLGHALLVAAPSTVFAIAAVGLAGLSMGYNAPLQSGLIASLDRADRGGGFGLFRTGYVLVGSLGAAVVGGIADLAGWPVAYGVNAGLFGLGLAVLAVAATGDRDGFV